MDKTRLAEKRYRDKKNKQDFRINNKRHEKQNEKTGKNEEDYKKYNNQLQKTKKTTKLQKKKQYELNKRRKLITKQNESKKEIKQEEKNEKEKIR